MILTPRPDDVDGEKDIAAFRLLVKLPDREISTGYGTRWTEKKRDMGYYVQVAESAGFSVIAREQDGQVVFLQLEKPQ